MWLETASCKGVITAVLLLHKFDVICCQAPSCGSEASQVLVIQWYHLPHRTLLSLSLNAQWRRRLRLPSGIDILTLMYTCRLQQRSLKAEHSAWHACGLCASSFGLPSTCSLCDSAHTSTLSELTFRGHRSEACLQANQTARCAHSWCSASCSSRYACSLSSMLMQLIPLLRASACRCQWRIGIRVADLGHVTSPGDGACRAHAQRLRQWLRLPGLPLPDPGSEAASER